MLLFPVPAAYSYSVLSHEAIIDSVWDSAIKPLLLQRFPAATADELRQAHAYAYGGSIIQDLGYYPFGSKLFSDLTHYVRSGDFILNMIRDSQDVNEYAFSLGALSHYASDSNGHHLGTNPAVALLYPKLGLRFGKLVTYADDSFSHMKTDFGFDVFQAAKGRFASQAYKDFIGFEVSKPVLERAFQDTYGLRLEQVFLSVDLAIGSYRRAIGSIFPAMTKIAWQLKKQEILKEAPGLTRRKFLYNLSRSSYEKNWGSTYQRPGSGSRFLAGLFRIVPRVGPFKVLRFQRLTPETEKMFMASFNAGIDRYREKLSEVKAARLELPNENLDTGEPEKPGAYRLADTACARLLDKLRTHYTDMPPELRAHILTYYQDLNVPFATKTDAKDWAKLLVQLDQLRAVNADLSRERKAQGAATGAGSLRDPQVSKSQ
ncbi:MAG: zinc dependent phospholipase C family protein [Bryobacteraceae bacterium]